MSMYAEGVQALMAGAGKPKVCECGPRAVPVAESDPQGREDRMCLKCGKALPGA